MEPSCARFTESGWIATISKPRFRIKTSMGHMKWSQP